ncbi:sulfur reduction protein DsrE [Ignatzschineria sp. RMDPL8A]|uniref:DsrE family protein n=1 Tax=Ignatzschineria sp. RMDPL8A TaxID=2999236 RepID=UPI001696952C|nr:hypothetical protein [Ignatzschineria sp. RMDPL8A]MDG9730239.1 sulfur reduction protein DsrE [Ignatzschineria sp. RMDPL8A]NLD09892.1 sulfur reduction protein DsrE [Xanthomonadaceae bacterium]
MYQVVFHLSDLPRWNRAINNIQNFLKAEPSATLVLVVNGDAVKGFVYPEVIDKLDGLLSQVLVCACANSLKGNDIELSHDTGIKTIQAGVVAIAQYQADGFAYIKP